MRHRLAGLTALCTLTFALLGTVLTTPAHADSAVVSVGNAVIYDTCYQKQFRYSVDPDMAAYDWSLWVTAYDPRGVEVSGGSVWKDDGYPASGISKGDDGLQICSSEMPGTWRIESEIHFYDGPYEDQTLPTSHISVRRGATRTSVAVNDHTARYKQVLTFKVKSTAEYPNGFFGNAYADVRLQRKASGRWVNIGKAMANENGVARFRGRWKIRAKTQVRAVTLAESPYTASTSKTLTIR
jgi:hypothetical protein